MIWAKALVMSIGAVVAAGPPAVTQSQAPGEAIFQQKCSSCHRIGGGTLVGPDLKGVTARRDRAWLLKWITGPDRTLAAGDSVAVQLQRQFNGLAMPNMGLSTTDAEGVLTYIERASPQAPTPAEAAAPAASPDTLGGRALFTGAARFANGGPPCMACHSIAGLGALGGGALGPDLTGASVKYGEAGLVSILASPPFPTMSPIFGRRPLTPPEQVAVRAFLQQAATARRPAEAVGRLAALAVAGALLLLGLAQATWRRRLGGVRRPMVERAAHPSSEPIVAGKEA